jgi:ACT domain-containing protein
MSETSGIDQQIEAMSSTEEEGLQILQQMLQQLRAQTEILTEIHVVLQEMRETVKTVQQAITNRTRFR